MVQAGEELDGGRDAGWDRVVARGRAGPSPSGPP